MIEAAYGKTHAGTSFVLTDKAFLTTISRFVQYNPLSLDLPPEKRGKNRKKRKFMLDTLSPLC
jgi:hypothetical protein